MELHVPIASLESIRQEQTYQRALYASLERIRTTPKPLLAYHVPSDNTLVRLFLQAVHFVLAALIRMLLSQLIVIYVLVESMHLLSEPPVLLSVRRACKDNHLFLDKLHAPFVPLENMQAQVRPRYA